MDVSKTNQQSTFATGCELAYLGSVMPSLSATFIYREILELERRGIRVSLYSIHKPDRQDLSEESLPLLDRTKYLLPLPIWFLICSHVYFATHRPLRYLLTLWRMLSPFYYSFKDRLRGLLHFGE